jgi:RNA polymerase sigma-70 factor (sigma-E family)
MDSRLADDFEGFYHANFGDTVAMSYGFTADIGEAQDIAQEAFARAWIRWRQLSTYENPAGWVRHVAANLARSRWRQLKRASSYLVGHRPDAIAGPNPDHVAVVAALRKLPPRQREAIVMHHLMDLSVEEVADQLRVPAGTVKSWLHRGRNALAVDLSIDVRSDVKIPPAGEIVQQAKKRQRRRSAQVALTLVLVILGAAAIAQFVLNRRHQPVINPTPLPSVSPSANPTNFLNVNWDSPTITLQDPPAGCPSGQITFRPTEFEGILGGPPGTDQRLNYMRNEIAFGDLYGDSKQEAAITASCGIPMDPPAAVGVMIVESQPDGSLLSRNWMSRPDSVVNEVWIDQGVVYIDVRPKQGTAGWDYELGQVVAYRLRDTELESPASNYVSLLPTRAASQVDLSPVAGKLTKCDNLAIPSTVKPSFDKFGVWQDGPRKWVISPKGLDNYDPVYVGLGTSRRYLLLSIACGASGTSTSLVLFDRAPGGGWAAVGVIAGEPFSGIELQKVTGPVVDVLISGQASTSYQWNGSEFVRKAT